MSRLLIIDAHAVFWRHHYALHANTSSKIPWCNSRGLWVAGLYGFTRSLLRAISELRPDALIVAGEGGANPDGISTPISPFSRFRHHIFPAYKQDRSVPPELLSALPYMSRIVASLGLPFVSADGLEADDVIASLVRSYDPSAASRIDASRAQFRNSLRMLTQLQSPSESAVAGRLLVDLDSQPSLAPPNSSYDISIVTLDKDLMQLISPHTCLIHPSALSQAGADKTKQAHIDRKSQEFKQLFTVDVPIDAESASQVTSPSVPLSAVNIDPSFVTTSQHVLQKFGCRPEQIVDFLALVGDTSDGIPGVPGIGAKGGAELLSKCHSIDQIYASIDAVPNKFKSKLVAGKANAFLSFALASLIHTLPLPLVEIQQHAQLSYSTSTQGDQTTMSARLKRPEFRALMTQLEFDSIVRQIDRTAL